MISWGSSGTWGLVCHLKAASPLSGCVVRKGADAHRGPWHHRLDGGMERPLCYRCPGHQSREASGVSGAPVAPSSWVRCCLSSPGRCPVVLRCPASANDPSVGRAGGQVGGHPSSLTPGRPPCSSPDSNPSQAAPASAAPPRVHQPHFSCAKNFPCSGHCCSWNVSADGSFRRKAASPVS